MNAMTTYYSKDFQSKPFKARPSDEQEVSKAKELLQMMKKVRQTMKESDSSVNLQIACKKCGNAAGKVLLPKTTNPTRWPRNLLLLFHSLSATTVRWLYDGAILFEGVSDSRLARS